ncbi:DUF6193 family natural product biosynthesis protein [Streptomyces sp. NPDC048577]|uniref:DUF6193 family natural product biosynthesis protein n=1 Tax=Streptomyces sp. NPDC048577 TaxID=3157209 RepID=UPI003421608E
MTEIVEAQWQKLLGTPDGPHWLQTSFTELVRAAYEQPRLRELYPWMGMWELHFSRCTEAPFSWDIPYAGPSRDGGYRVEGPSRSQYVGEAASAHEAIAMVIERLPRGCGPAFNGTAVELAAYEGKQDIR